MWKFSSQAAIFKDSLHVKTKIINHKSQSSRRDGLRFMDIWPQKLLSDLTPYGIFAQWNTFLRFLLKYTKNGLEICQWKTALVFFTLKISKYPFILSHSHKKNTLNDTLLECWLTCLLKAFPIHLHPCPWNQDDLVWSRGFDEFLQDAI